MQDLTRKFFIDQNFIMINELIHYKDVTNVHVHYVNNKHAHNLIQACRSTYMYDLKFLFLFLYSNKNRARTKKPLKKNTSACRNTDSQLKTKLIYNGDSVNEGEVN